MATDDSLSRIIIDTGKRRIGHHRFMKTHAEFTYATGLVQGVTRTFTKDDFEGFASSVMVILADADRVAVPGGQSPLYRYQVDGRRIGRSDRTDAWPTLDQPFSVPVTESSSVVYIYLFHSADPDNFQKVLDMWNVVSASVPQLAAYASSTAKMFIGRSIETQSWLPGLIWPR